jgi:predicted ABC-type ATPase
MEIEKPIDYYDNLALQLAYPKSWEKLVDEKASGVWDDVLLKTRDLVQPVSRPNFPVVYLLGGQPGAGKSSLEKELIENHFKNNAFFISMDDYRKKHPLFDEIHNAEGGDKSSLFTHFFAGCVADKIVQRIIENKYNFVLEGTLAKYSAVENRIKLFRQNNYECNIAIITCPTTLSRFSAVYRYERNKHMRYVKTDIHEKIVNVLPETLEKIYKNLKDDLNRFTIQSRESVIWSKEDDPFPDKAFLSELNRFLTMKEISFIQEKTLSFSEESKIKVIRILEKESLNLLNKSFLDEDIKSRKASIDRFVYKLKMDIKKTIPNQKSKDRDKDDFGL